MAEASVGCSSVTYVLLVHALLLRVPLLLGLQQRLQAIRLLLQQSAALLPLLHLPVELLHQRLQLLQRGAFLRLCRSLWKKRKPGWRHTQASVAAPSRRPEVTYLRRCGRRVSGQRRLQMDDVGLFLRQLPVPLRQHGVHFLTATLL